ncbi:MAG TPA: hypothetical protein V6C81_05550 [Planktothrix sp.]|jgi:hypothetical protein
MSEQTDLMTTVKAARSSLQDNKERFRRALAFSTALGMQCSNLLTNYIEHCRDQAMSGSTDPFITQDEFAYCVKTLMCVQLWLLLLEQQTDIPEEMRLFVLESMNLADRLYELPPAKLVMTSYDVTAGPQVIRESVSFNICLRLNLGGTAPDALVQLSEVLRDVRPHREQLMQMCLTKSLSDLDQMISQG